MKYNYTVCVKSDGYGHWFAFKNYNSHMVMEYVKCYNLNCTNIEFVNSFDAVPSEKSVVILIKNTENNNCFNGKFEELKNWLSGIKENQVTIE